MAQTQDGPDERSDWWHVVAVMPAVPLSTFLPDPLGTLLVLAFLLLFPVALWGDVQCVRTVSDWRPGLGFVVLSAAGVVLTVGLLSVVVSPYYLYRRHQHVGRP